MKIMLSFFVLAMLLAFGQESFACNRDARLCSDGTGRGRDPSRNCQFWPPCPEDRVSVENQAALQVLNGKVIVNPDFLSE